MLPLGHLGVTLLVARAWVAGTGRPVALPWLVLGAFLPDLVDKPLALWLVEYDSGRLWGHTLLAAAALGASWLAARRPAWLGALAVGTLLHQLEDGLPIAGPGVWLWPLLGPMPRGDGTGPAVWLDALLHDPLVQASEAVGLVATVLLLVRPLAGRAKRWWLGARDVNR